MLVGRAVFRGVAVTILLLALTGVPWGKDKLHAQITGTSTGWCSDYEGNNFPCSDGGGYSGGGGSYGSGGYGGCATSQRPEATEGAVSAVNIAEQASQEGDWRNAAYLLETALDESPNYDLARSRLGSAYNNLGNEAMNNFEELTAVLYYERALEKKPESEVIRANYENALRQAPSKNCSTCGKALFADVSVGLGGSAQFYTYVHQATANYKNCTRRLSCQGTDGESFFSLMRSCMTTFASSVNGFRACVDESFYSNPVR